MAMTRTAHLTLGPVLLNWPTERWRDFYFEVADEMPVETVFLGEVVCSKRAPLFDPHLEAVVTRLEGADKKLVFSTLAEVTGRIDRKLVERVSAWPAIEVNDVSALSHLDGRDHAIGPYMNVYNEESLAFFAENGARSVCLPPEIPAAGVAALGQQAEALGVELEVQVYGRIPLALSARCYHARAHGRTKDSCQFICDRDPDGMVLNTLDDAPFLTINGIQTQSYACLNLTGELEELREFGVNRFRISPQSTGTREAVDSFRAVLDGRITSQEANDRLGDSGFDATFAKGFFHGEPGYQWRAQ